MDKFPVEDHEEGGTKKKAKIGKKKQKKSKVMKKGEAKVREKKKIQEEKESGFGLCEEGGREGKEEGGGGK
jgi:hypothetical protein